MADHSIKLCANAARWQHDAKPQASFFRGRLARAETGRSAEMNKPRGRPFEPGNKYGRGRPKGSRNKEKYPGEKILDEYGPHIMFKCISQALNGDHPSMRPCMEQN